jgi:hypothetical protein
MANHMPMDSADIAQKITETYLRNMLKKQLADPVPFSGFCLCCKDPAPNRRFCDSACREIYEHKQRMRRIDPTQD